MEMSTSFWIILFVLLILLQLISLIIMKLNCSPILKLYAFFWPNKRSLQNKTIWVVGSSTGIGKELALQLAKLNCRLILTSTNQTKLDEVKQACLERSKYGIQPEEILALACDIRVQDQCDAAFSRVVGQFGDIDALICNAGRATAGLITDDDYYDELKSTFEINFFSHVYLTRLVLKHWLSIKKRDGLAKLDRRILYTSSTFSIIESHFCSAYCASKRSLNIFAHDLALQHQAKDGISVCIVHPGPTESNLISNSTQKRELNSDSIPKMKTRHCAHLMLVALANRVHESYVCHQPVLFVTYLYDNFWWYLLFLLRSFDLVEPVQRRFFKEPESSAL